LTSSSLARSLIRIFIRPSFPPWIPLNPSSQPHGPKFFVPRTPSSAAVCTIVVLSEVSTRTRWACCRIRVEGPLCCP
jgi:hypothetical protein